MSSWKISDGNAVETYTSWGRLIEAAEGWYDYYCDVPKEDLRGADLEDFPLVDYSEIEEGDVKILNEAIGLQEEAIAEWLGHKPFYGHGNYSVSAASQAGLFLVVVEVV